MIESDVLSEEYLKLVTNINGPKKERDKRNLSKVVQK